MKAKPQLKIERGIPIPSRRSDSGLMATMRRMDIGDSFLWGGRLGSVNNLYVFAAKAGIRIAIRTSEEGVRVWRIDGRAAARRAKR